jgi:flagellin-like protein
LKAKKVTLKRAISPILATLLLVVIAVAAIVVTYAWVMTYMSNAGKQAGVMMYAVNVYFYNVSGVKTIDVTMGNSGSSDTQIIGLYVGTSSSSLQNQTITASTLPAGKTQTITVNYDWTAGTPYYFKVVSSSGQVVGPWPAQAPANS